MGAPDQQAELDGIPAKPEVKMVARFSALAAKILYPFIAKKDIRMYLGGINIRPLEEGGCMLTATDGGRFIVIRDPNAWVEQETTVEIDKDGLKHATAAKATFDVMSDGVVRISGEHGAELFIQPGNSLIDSGQYPRIENIVNLVGYQEGIQGAINPSYISDAIEIGGHFRGVRFFTRDPDSPLLFVYSALGEMECFGGIAKMRDSFDQLPTWFPKRGTPTRLSEV